MSDGMGRELAYLSSHATNRYFIPNCGKFYQLLLDGYSSREALKGAQQFLASKGGEFSAPIYWGSFEIMD